MCSSLNTQIFISLDIHCLCHCKESIPDHHDLHHFISVCYVLKQVIAFFTMVVAALFTNDGSLSKAYQKASSTLLFKPTHHCIYFTIINVHTLHKAYIKVLLLSTPRVLLLQKSPPKLQNSPLDNSAFNQDTCCNKFRCPLEYFYSKSCTVEKPKFVILRAVCQVIK